MKKLIILSAFVLALAVASSASAASISNIRLDNNQTQKTVAPGESVNVTFRVTVPAGEVVELGEIDVLGDSLAPALPTQLGGELGLQEGQHDVSMTVTAPQNTGYYTISFKTAGIYGGQRAIVMTDGVVSSASFGSAIRVVDPSSTSGSTSGSSNAPSWFSPFQASLDALMKLVAELTKKVNEAPTGSPAPAESQLCKTFKGLYASAPYGSSNAHGLQSFLIQNGFSIPAGVTGYHGSQTSNAASAFRMANNCY